MKEFIETFEELLQRDKISRNKLSKELAISTSTIQSWYNGSEPSLDKAKKIADYFNVSIDTLVGKNCDISHKEMKIIEHYRKLDDNTKLAIDTLLKINSNDEGKSLTSKIG